MSHATSVIISLISLAISRTRILEVLAKVQAEHAFRLLSYTGMEIADLMALTGLSEAWAGQSMEREFGESLVWLGELSEPY